MPVLLVDGDVLRPQPEQLAASRAGVELQQHDRLDLRAQMRADRVDEVLLDRTHRIGLRRHRAARERARPRRSVSTVESWRCTPLASSSWLAAQRKTVTTRCTCLFTYGRDHGRRGGLASRHPSPSRRGPREAGSAELVGRGVAVARAEHAKRLTDRVDLARGVGLRRPLPVAEDEAR